MAAVAAGWFGYGDDNRTVAARFQRVNRDPSAEVYVYYTFFTDLFFLTFTTSWMKHKLRVLWFRYFGFWFRNFLWKCVVLESLRRSRKRMLFLRKRLCNVVHVLHVNYRFFKLDVFAPVEWKCVVQYEPHWYSDTSLQVCILLLIEETILLILVSN